MLTPVSTRIRGLIARHAISLFFFLSAIITWPFLAELDLFDRFHAFSRSHEDYELDEIVLLVFNLVIALALSVFVQSKKLKKLMRERAVLHEVTEKIARHDPLTGLMNRRAFTDVLRTIEQTSLGGKARIIAVIDLDKFKPINDLYGHAAGDATLQAVSARLKDQGASLSAIARLGGDEFALVFNESIDTNQAERTIRRLLHAMETAIEFEDRKILLSCSIGLVKWQKEFPYSEAIRRADKALYLSKKSGRGHYAWYDEELDRQSHERAEIEADLKMAIATSQIKPWYQPIIEIKSKRLVGFEILARWTHETRGAVPPLVFIELAEDSGQIGNLGYSVLRQACMDAKNWDQTLSMSFNVSPSQFHEPNLVDHLKKIMDDCGFDPARLTIEVTESSVIQDFDIARSKLEDLKSIGISVALDDFGTGYSSLASLRQLPFDRIKIDRSFVTGIADVPQNQKIVDGIMALATGLNLDVTAEGIETWQDLEYLGASHCSLGQGFLFEKALAAEQVSWLLETSWSDGIITPAALPLAAQSGGAISGPPADLDTDVAPLDVPKRLSR